jgi:hypothetical protein
MLFNRIIRSSKHITELRQFDPHKERLAAFDLDSGIFIECRVKLSLYQASSSQELGIEANKT